MSTPKVIICATRVLGGPNRYAHMPVLQVDLDIGPYETRSSKHFPGCVKRLLNWLPGLSSHTCSAGRLGGFVERLQQGTYLAHIVEHLALELQNQIGFEVSFGRARSLGEPGLYRVVVAYREAAPPVPPLKWPCSLPWLPFMIKQSI